jgi:hypothetical protein
MYHIITECLIHWSQPEKFFGIENATIRALVQHGTSSGIMQDWKM